MKSLLDNIKTKKAKIGVIGLGYVGLPLVSNFLKNGFEVIGIDVDHAKIKSLKSGKSYIAHIDSSFIKDSIDNNLKVSSDISSVSKLDIIILCLPTPLNKNKEPDMSFVFNTINELIPYLRRGQALSLESTTYPGTTSEDVFGMLQEKGLVAGKDINLIYSPEREDPGNAKFNTATIPKIVSGHTESCLRIGEALYSSIVDTVVPVSSTQTAELTKLLENIYRAVNIGLVNEMKIVSEKLGIDIYEVIDAASTKPFGFTPYYPGPGIGGHCIPIDPFYLTWKAKQHGVHTKFIELAGEINNSMPLRALQKVEEVLLGKNLEISSSKILLLGMAYKKDVDDMRESPSISILQLLEDKGAEVNYSDPFIPVFPDTRKYEFNRGSLEINAQTLQDQDLVILCTDHTQFDYEFIRKESTEIIDTRGVYRGQLQANIHRA